MGCVIEKKQLKKMVILKHLQLKILQEKMRTLNLLKRENLEIGVCGHCNLPVAGNYFRQFDFDHLPMYKKLKNISQMCLTKKYSLEEVSDEIQKTQLLCANCHIVKTSLRKQVQPVLSSILSQIDNIFGKE